MSGDSERTLPRDLSAIPAAKVELERGPSHAIPSRYQVEGIAGTGGSATVYKARDTVLQRPVAIKVMSSEGHPSDHATQRFEREARLLAAMRHPGIVEIYDVGHLVSGEPFLVMEWMDQGSLRDFVDQHGPLSEERVRTMAQELCRALAAAHDTGIIHRDLKPHNLLLDRAGNPHLSDFGVARSDDDTAATSTGRIVGTLQYMAPEQLRGKAVPASDVYALALSLVFLLTGDRDPAALKGKVSPSFARFLRTCTHYDENQRPEDGAAMLDALLALHNRPYLGKAVAIPLAVLLLAGVLVAGRSMFFASDQNAGNGLGAGASAPTTVAADAQSPSIGTVPAGGANESQGLGAAGSVPIADSSAGGDGKAANSAGGANAVDAVQSAPPSSKQTTAAKNSSTSQVAATNPKDPKPAPSDEPKSAPKQALRLEHQPPAGGTVGQSVLLTLHIDGGPAARAKVFYLNPSEPNDQREYSMSMQGETATYKLLINSVGNWRYWFEAQDQQGQIFSLHSKTDPFTLESR